MVTDSDTDQSLYDLGSRILGYPWFKLDWTTSEESCKD